METILSFGDSFGSKALLLLVSHGGYSCRSNIEPENDGLEDIFPFPRGVFSGSMLIFLGVYIMAASPQITPFEYEPFVNETIGPGLGQVTGRRLRENKNIQPSIKKGLILHHRN